jgi:hypothetical protein
VVRVAVGEPDPDVGDAAGVPEPGVVETGEVWVPVHPAMAIAPQRSTITITVILNCISERASLSYIMFVLPPCTSFLRIFKKIDTDLKRGGAVLFKVLIYSHLIIFLSKSFCANRIIAH